MQSIVDIQKIAVDAVKRLRKRRLSAGIYFMINSNALPSDHCYLEYPNGTIKLAVYESSAKDFTILRELEDEESRDLRNLFED